MQIFSSVFHFVVTVFCNAVRTAFDPDDDDDVVEPADDVDLAFKAGPCVISVSTTHLR